MYASVVCIWPQAKEKKKEFTQGQKQAEVKTRRAGEKRQTNPTGDHGGVPDSKTQAHRHNREQLRWVKKMENATEKHDRPCA